ncbi:MAG: OsmC family protein [Solirubrobacterales bacterium]
MVKAVAKRRQGFTHDVEIQGGHRLVIDEPEVAGGANEGPSPTRTVAAALAACTAITVEMYAERKGWDVGDLQVEVDMEYGDHSVPRSFEVTVHLPSELSAEQCERLRTIAAKCPVHRLLAKDRHVAITDRVEIDR